MIKIKKKEEYKHIHDKTVFLELDEATREELTKYNDLLTDNNKYQQHFNMINCFKRDETIHEERSKYHNETMEVNLLKNVYYKN